MKQNNSKVSSAFAAVGVVSFLALGGCASQSEADHSTPGSREQNVGTTYQVGPGKAYATLQAVASLVAAGDVVEVYGNGSSYAGGVVFANAGTKAAPITIRGMRTNGARPVIAGGTNTLEFQGDNYVFEGFEVTGGTFRCVFHHDDNLTIRDAVIHDCAGHGILSADSDSGSLTLEYTEVYAAGAGTNKHPVYVATDEVAHPGSVFRMHHCYLHDQNGGNNVKSRAERNEIYYNWIEGGTYRELELIEPDGAEPTLAREDSDVVGNVLFQKNGSYAVRFGGDGGGYGTAGRYRFVANTIVMRQGSSAAFQAFDHVESAEMHDNIVYRTGGASVEILRDSDAIWTTGAQVVDGRNNWVTNGSSAIPAGWSGTVAGTNPGFVDVASKNVRLAAGASAIGAAASWSQLTSVAGHEFPSPLAAPLANPPMHALEANGSVSARSATSFDMGAFGTASIAPPQPPPPPPVTPTGACVTSSGFQSQSIGAKTGTFSVQADVTPLAASIDGAIALSQGTKTSWGGLAAIVLFSPDGVIRARNGGTYGADATLKYAANGAYHVRIDADVTHHTYSVTVTPAGGTAVKIATNYAFRTESASVTSLDTLGIDVDTGSLRGCGVTVH